MGEGDLAPVLGLGFVGGCVRTWKFWDQDTHSPLMITLTIAISVY